MVMVFKCLEELSEYLKKDERSFSINPVRFINVDSMPMWIEAKKILLSYSDEMVTLSSFCDSDDTTPNLKRLSSRLKKATKSVLVTPLSEYLRIVPERAESVIQEIIKMSFANNDDGRLRIYILMYRMRSLLITLPSDDPRAKDCVNYLETNEENDYKLTIIQKELDVGLAGNEIFGFKNYLKYWEANPDKPIILHTQNAIHFEYNHFFDNVQVIVSSYALLKYQYDLPVGVEEKLGSSIEWDYLVKEIIKAGTFENACCSGLQINRYSSSLLSSWSRLSTYQQWLLWLWARNQNGDSYEIQCARACSNKNEFIDELYCFISNKLTNDDYIKLYKQRKEVLANICSFPTDRFWAVLKELKKEEALRCLTDLSDIERKHIFSIIREFSYEEKNKVSSIIRIVYPDLYFYLGKSSCGGRFGLSERQIKYFDEYKWLKVTDTFSKHFYEEVQKIALEKGESIFTMKPRNSYVKEHYDDSSLVLFVDGMGVEYVDYLEYLFSDINTYDYMVTIEAGFCNLPSITELNKDFMLDRRTADPPVRELDDLKHANNVYPESIVKQIDILKQIKDRTMGLLVGGINKIIIASDHGTSRMAVKVRDTEFDAPLPKPENRDVYKYGRFCEGTDDEEQYPTAICYNERLIFADYHRFLQSGAPIDEIHGGASWEEWIVPIITVEKTSNQAEQEVVVTPLVSNYKVDLKRTIEVRFLISGVKRKNVEARVNGNSYKCSINEDGEYSFEYRPARGESTLVVRVVDKGILGQFNIIVDTDQGIKKNTKFDI